MPRRRGLLAQLAPKPGSPVPDGEMRTRMRTLDPLERKIGWVVGALPLLLAVITLPNVLHDTPTTALEKLVKGRCLAPGHLVGKSCIVHTVYTPAHFALYFALYLVLAAVILFAVWRSLRVLVAVASLFAGLATSVLGVLSVFYGAWLLLRSWRLQRYGVADGASVRKIAVERTAQRRETKRTAPDKVTASGPRPATQSKRYTPKAKPKQR